MRERTINKSTMWIMLILAIILVAGGIYYFALTAANTNENVNAANVNSASGNTTNRTTNFNSNSQANTNIVATNSATNTATNTNTSTTANINAAVSNTNSSKNTNTAVVTKEVSVTPSGFFPATVTIAKGGTIMWTNNSADTAYVVPDDHPAHKKYAGIWDDDGTGEIAPGETYSHTFATSGTYTYHNSEAESQTGIIVVE